MEPVIQETHMESKSEERDREICSGSKPVTWRRTRGSVSGKSIAFPRRDVSNGTVTGTNGPSNVDGI